MHRRADRRRGFTLIEVMVALAIVAIAVPALLFTLDQQIDGTAYLRDRSLAQVVAANRLSELRLALRGGERVFSGSLSGSESIAGRDWYWRMNRTDTQVPQFTRVEIAVSESEGEEATPLYTLIAFMTVEENG